jgi:hypothetical protein
MLSIPVADIRGLLGGPSASRLIGITLLPSITADMALQHRRYKKNGRRIHAVWVALASNDELIHPYLLS